ncbi:putative serine/threonine-protein kinase PBL1 [Bidens hawaiensis]|uniref:putative serine/threonine-protein kinase PBL1 n=1 Tax=Bidens hawaiensis TaxID=980011 RepID=UPI00404B07E9
MAATSSSTSGPIHYKHDVYLCFRGFRGEDSRYSFITNLYEALSQAGINTFSDGVETSQRRGEPMQDIEKVISESRASVIILSEKFGTSRQCLDELLLILEQRRQNNHFVLPVFYKVDPLDVRNQRGRFTMEAGVKGSNWTQDKVNQWKAALREVGSLSGMVLSGSETAFIADIVSAIIRALDSKSSSFVSEFEHLRIHLGELKKATNSFRSKVLGTGGFGKVYEGEISHSQGRSLVAIKRLNREFGQGDPEFWKEIMMLSRYTHRNLISLLGFCDEDGEKILVYEHASNGSLDRHLSSTVLTWTQRLKICLDAARGLAYLHDDKGSQQRVLHRDIKSANILLDKNWNAKLSDMGLSKLGPANQHHTVLITNIVGTPGYCDPQYMETYSLTKESDIYSFGVVLFEVLCGRLCFDYTNGRLKILVPTWKQSYMHKKLDHIIFKDLTSQMDPTSLEIFSNIAFQCLHYDREQRPKISILVERLETALEFQKRHDRYKSG